MNPPTLTALNYSLVGTVLFLIAYGMLKLHCPEVATVVLFGAALMYIMAAYEGRRKL